MKGAIMAVGASQPTVVATKDGRIGMKNQMQVTLVLEIVPLLFLSSWDLLMMPVHLQIHR